MMSLWLLQVTTRRICFMLDERVRLDESGGIVLVVESSEPKTDRGGLEGMKEQQKDARKDKLWPLSSLKEVYTRR